MASSGFEHEAVASLKSHPMVAGRDLWDQARLDDWKSLGRVAIISKACGGIARNIKMQGLCYAFKEKWMVKDRSLAVFLALALVAGSAWTQTVPATQTLPRPGMRPEPASDAIASPSAADRFWEIAYEMAHSQGVTGPQADQAIVLLTAAKTLNSRAAVEPLLLELATRYGTRDYSQQVRLWLESYVNETADRAIVAGAVKYLLDRLSMREDRQKLLQDLTGKIGNRNPTIDSDLATMLSRIMVEQGDLKAAKFYLIQAYTNNKYNAIAFAGLAELAADEIGAAAYLEHLRLALRENPLDIDAALNFAQYAERLQLYDVAAGTYGYCAALFQYLYPSQPLPPRIYLPWAIANYNTERGQDVCLRIAESVRKTGRFDILLEAITGKAAMKMGDPQQAQRIFDQAELKAQQLLQAGPSQTQGLQAGGMTTVGDLGPKQFAWFYCFARPDPEKALDWANKAYAIEPNVPAAGALMAYALGMGNLLEWAKPLLESFRGNQISDIVRAQVQLAQGDKAGAIKTLTVAVAKDPGSLAAERAREMLRREGSEYAPPIDPRALRSVLADSLGQTLVPRFLPPDKMMEVQFNVRGNEFSYGAEIEATVVIANNGSELLVITDNGLFSGRVRVDARVSGSLTADIPNLASQTTRTELTVPPGRSLVSTLRLSTGKLRRMLLDHPQASLTVEFTLYVDPVVAENGSVHNRLADVKPLTVSVTRPGIDLTASYVRNRFNAVSSGQEAQKVRTARLFTGLLKEQHAMAQRGTLYPYRCAEWLPKLLRSALLVDSGLLLSQGADDWVVKVNTLADMLSMPIDQELAAAAAKSLHDPKWPVRLTALYLLATDYGNRFDNVLDWMAENDTNDMVRIMAVTLRSAGSEVMPSKPTAVSGPLRQLP